MSIVGSSSSTQDALRKRSEERRTRMVSHKARHFSDAEDWDLKYWQQQGPEERLRAFLAIREDIAKVQRAKGCE